MAATTRPARNRRIGRLPDSIIPIRAAAARAAAPTAVIRAADAGSADAADRLHALGEAGVVAAHGAARGAAAVLRAPWVVVGGLRVAGRRDEQGGGDEAGLQWSHGGLLRPIP